MASRPRRSAGAPKRFSPPPTVAPTRKRGQQDAESATKIEQPDEEVVPDVNDIVAEQPEKDGPQPAKKPKAPRKTVTPKAASKKELPTKTVRTEPSANEGPPTKSTPKAASARKTSTKPTPTKASKKGEAEEEQVEEETPETSFVKIEPSDEIEEYAVPNIILTRAVRQVESVATTKREQPGTAKALEVTKSKRKHVLTEPENRPLKDGLTPAIEKSSAQKDKLLATKKGQQKESSDEEEDGNETPAKRSKPTIRTDKMPLPVDFDNEQAEESVDAQTKKPTEKSAEKSAENRTKKVQEGEKVGKESSTVKKAAPSIKTHKFDLSELEIPKKSKHEQETPKVQEKHPAITIVVSSTLSATSNQLQERKHSHETEALTSKTKEKSPLVVARKHSDQRDKAPVEQKREHRKSFDAGSTNPKLTVRTDKHELPISTDPFKKPRPVQPSPVQRSASTSKPSPSPSVFGAFDLLDSIMEKQDRTMQDLNKSEEQKASERQRLEIERRRKSAENPFEKAAAMSRAKGMDLPANQPLSVSVKSEDSQPSTPSDTTGSIHTPRESQQDKEKSPKNLEKERKSASIEKSPSGIAEKQPAQLTPKEQPPIDFAETPIQSTATIETTVQITETIIPMNIEDIPLPDETISHKLKDLVNVANVEESPGESSSTESSPAQTPTVVEQQTLIQLESTRTETIKEEAVNEESTSSVENEDVRPYEPETPGIDVASALEAVRLAEKEAEDSMNSAELLASANLILKNLQQASANDAASGTNITYEQIVISDGESSNSAKDPEEKPPTDFYGEPVPSDDDEDDKLFEMAAGLPKKKDALKKPIEEEALPNNEMIELDYYNADINIKSDAKNKWLIDPDNGDGFALMWGCVRSNYGLRLPNNVGDRSAFPPYVVYQVQIKEYLPIKHLPFEEAEPYDLRLGWSADSVRSIIGESPNSYAYCASGRKASTNFFADFGQNAQVCDYITVALDLMNNEMRVFLNDTDLGVPYTDLRFHSFTSTEDFTIVFPHIGLKNVRCFVNFGVEKPNPECEQAWPLPSFLADKPYKFFGELNRFPSNIVSTPRPPPSKSDCTVIFMVGLPAAGKSKWVEQYLREHENERWIILNSDAMLNLMRINGVPRKRIHQGRWDAVMGLAAKAASRAFQLMCRRRHNYIIDQTNVSRDKRKQKLALFQDFVRKCAVLVPSVDDFEHRQMKQARDDPTDQITPEALLQLKGMFTLPEADQEPFDEVIFIEPPPERIGEAVELVRRFNEEGRPYLPVYNQRRR